MVWAKNTSFPHNPVMGFILQRSQQTDKNAIRTTKIEGKISLRMIENANVELCGAFCPDANVMTQHGKWSTDLSYQNRKSQVHFRPFLFLELGSPVGFAQSVGRVLEASRVLVGWISVGICMGALEQTISYVNKRKAFGAPLSSNQLIQGEPCFRALHMFEIPFCTQH